MMELLSYLLFFTFIAIGFVYPQKKPLTFCYAVYIWILMGLNTYTPDYDNYVARYEMAMIDIASDSFDTFDTEWGYKLLNIIFNLLGFTYQEFRMFFSALYAILAVSTLMRLTNSKSQNFALSLFLIFPFLPCVSGQRQAMANIIACWAIPFLLDTKKLSIVKYLICIILAASIHNSALFYIIFIFAKKRISNLYRVCIYISVVVLTLFMYTSSSISRFTSLFDNNKMEKYLDRSAGAVNNFNLIGFTVAVLLVVLLVFVVNSQTKILTKSIYKRKDLSSDLLYRNKINRVTLYNNICTLTLFVIPGYVVSGIFQRLVMGILPVCYALFSEYKTCKLVAKDRRALWNVIAVSIVFLQLISYIIGNMGNHDVFATLTDNMLFE